jgi:putative transposase
MSDASTVYKGFQFKLQPTEAQEQQFVRYCGAVRWVWNRMLAERSETYRTTGKSPSTHAQIKQLPILKQQAETAWLSTVQSQVLQDAVLDLDDAFHRFFSKQNGYPKFKTKHGRKQSFSYPQDIKVEGNTVFLPKIGWVWLRRSSKPKRYREIEGTIKRATIRRKASGWYVSLLCEIELTEPESGVVTPENSVGIDLGSIDLVTLSSGEKIANPRHYRKAERRLKRAQRVKARRKPGSQRHAQAKQRVAQLHEQIANRRQDDLHQISRRLVDENQALFCEDLNVQGIARRLGKSVHDAGWSELVRQLAYKARWAGKTFYQIGRYFPSSMTCSCCLYKHSDLTLSERIWACPSCGAVLDRDLNAAINIHREGLRHLAAGQSERQNARGAPIRPARRARRGEARISRLKPGKCQTSANQSKQGERSRWHSIK